VWAWWRAGGDSTAVRCRARNTEHRGREAWSRLSGTRQGQVHRGMERSKKRLLLEKSTCGSGRTATARVSGVGAVESAHARDVVTIRDVTAPTVRTATTFRR
jgi:hypothetical protein